MWRADACTPSWPLSVPILPPATYTEPHGTPAQALCSRCTQAPALVYFMRPLVTSRCTTNDSTAWWLKATNS